VDHPHRRNRDPDRLNLYVGDFHLRVPSSPQGFEQADAKSLAKLPQISRRKEFRLKPGLTLAFSTEGPENKKPLQPNPFTLLSEGSYLAASVPEGLCEKAKILKIPAPGRDS
jgi:hypothetical protein